MGNTIYLTGFPGPAGCLDAPTMGQFAIDVGADPVDLQASRGLALLLRAALIDPDDLSLLQGPPYPAGLLDAPTGFEIGFAGRLTTIWPAASLSRSSAPDDTPANTFVPGKLMPLNYAIKLFDGIEPTPEGSGGVGSIVLPDPDGELDDLVDLAWDGAALDILRGQPTGRYDGYETVGRMTTAGLLYDQRKKEIRLRDLGWLLGAAELHGYRYTGTGGSSGDAALAGAIKPYAVGPVFNVEPLRINASLEIHQLSCSSIQAVDAVRDGGIALAFDSDYPSYAALAAATVPAAHYATCRAEGMLRLGSSAAYLITADFRGDADIVNGHTYPDTMARIVRRIAMGRGTFRLGESQIDSVAFARFASERTATCGYYWPGEITKAEALNEVVSGCLGWWVVRPNGLLAIGYIDEPTAVPAIVLNYPEDFAGPPTMLSTYQVPRRGTYIGWRRNYTQQDASRLALAVDQASALIYGAAGRVASDVDGYQPTFWPTSASVSAGGAYLEESAARAEAQRQQRVMGTRRERWGVPALCDPFADLLGRVVQVNNFPRYGWGSARKFICAGMSSASSRGVTLELWG